MIHVLTFALYGIQFVCLVKFGLMHLHYESFVLFYSLLWCFFPIVFTDWNAVLGDPLNIVVQRRGLLMVKTEEIYVAMEDFNIYSRTMFWHHGTRLQNMTFRTFELIM
jgi:hypothetical protein